MSSPVANAGSAAAISSTALSIPAASVPVIRRRPFTCQSLTRWLAQRCAKVAAGGEARGVIRAIVFDIGWVFVKLDRQAILDCLQEHGCGPLDVDSLMTRIRLEDHETGRLHGHGLMEHLAALGTKPIALDL